MVFCCAFGCSNRLRKGSGISFFRFPKNSVTKRQWIHNLKRKDFRPTQYSAVCSEHFDPSSFERNASLLQRFGYEGARNRLKADAVPTIFNFPPGLAKVVSSAPPRAAFVKRRRREVLQKLFPKVQAPVASSADECQPEISTSYHNPPATDSIHVVEEENISPILNPSSTSTSSCLAANTVDSKTQVNIKPFMRTRRINVRPTTRDIGVQVDTAAACTCRSASSLSSLLEDPIVEEVESDNHLDLPPVIEDDPEYFPQEESDSSESDYEEDFEELGTPVHLRTDNEPNEDGQFLVSEFALAQLFSTCRTCNCPVQAQLKRAGGTLVVVNVLCNNGHHFSWHSQRLHNGLAWGNVSLACAILFSGSSVSKSLTFLKHLNMPVFTLRSYFKLQKCYLIPAVCNVWRDEQESLLQSVKGKPLVIGGDGRCDSPGYCAKYGSYNVMDLQTKKILHTQLIQSNEVKSSVHMELEGLKRSLKLLGDYQCEIQELVTDRHCQIKKYMAENQKGIDHYFDVWHVSKGVTKKLELAAKKKKFQEIQPWIKSVGNHMYWVASSCGNDQNLKLEKWLSLLNHITNVHTGHGENFKECEHGELDSERAWLKKGSKAYKMLEEVVTKKHLTKDIGKLSPKHQTYSLEVFHNVVNHFASKQQNYFYCAMESRMYLAALHFNENGDLEQKTTKDGDLMWAVNYPKSKKGEAAVVKRIKQSPTYGYVCRLKAAVTEQRLKFPTYCTARKAANSNPPKSLTSGFVKIPKLDLVARQQTRFC